MSELMNSASEMRNTRWQLLVSVSAVALLAVVSASGVARAAEDADRPSLWVELGGQLQRIVGGEEWINPPFAGKHISEPYNTVSPLSLRAAPRYGFSGEGKLTFTPQGTDWAFSVGAQFGRTNGFKERHQQTSTTFSQTNGLPPDNPFFKIFLRYPVHFNHVSVESKESHAIADFKAGKDVGLGMFGGAGSSTISLGVRFAQFVTKSNTIVRSFPDLYYPHNAKYISKHRHHTYYAHAQNERSFRGVGPEISWDGAVPIVGKTDSDGLTFDWGVNAALLFGRQKASGIHMTSNRLIRGTGDSLNVSYDLHTAPFTRSQSHIVPNLGGFAGISARYTNAKFSLGYRGDFFFGAMDGGLASRDTRNRSFHGPFASISVGLGG